jgi:hypothetical protein
MKWISYGWSAFQGLLELLVALILLTKFNTAFERVAIDLLILIYISIVASYQVARLTLIQQARVSWDRFIAVWKAVDAQAFADAEEERKDRLVEDERKVGIATMKIYIRGSFVFLIYLATLWNLLLSLGA